MYLLCAADVLGCCRDRNGTHLSPRQARGVDHTCDSTAIYLAVCRIEAIVCWFDVAQASVGVAVRWFRLECDGTTMCKWGTNNKHPIGHAALCERL